LAGRDATIAFTPHLVPMTRGILVACYARPKGAPRQEQLYGAAQSCYRGESFVRVVHAENGRSPHTRWATGSNLAFLSYAVNSRTGLVIALGAVDNLGKGASAQALQNANLMTGQPETAGLAGLPLSP
jgi:N-acetyl-gamma-glutamyl-phosphate reductase